MSIIPETITVSPISVHLKVQCLKGKLKANRWSWIGLFSEFLSKHPFPRRLLNFISSILQDFSIIFSISIVLHSFYFVTFFYYFSILFLSPINSLVFELCFAPVHVVFLSGILFNILCLFSSHSSSLSTSNILIIPPVFLYYDLGFSPSSFQFHSSSLHYFPQHPNISFSPSLQHVSFFSYEFPYKFFCFIFVNFYSNANKIFFFSLNIFSLNFFPFNLFHLK